MSVSPEKIVISYWDLSKPKDLYVEHNSEHPYSEENLLGCLQYPLSKGYTTMFRPSDDGKTIIVYIGKGKLTQR